MTPEEIDLMETQILQEIDRLRFEHNKALGPLFKRLTEIRARRPRYMVWPDPRRPDDYFEITTEMGENGSVIFRWNQRVDQGSRAPVIRGNRAHSCIQDDLKITDDPDYHSFRPLSRTRDPKP